MKSSAQNEAWTTATRVTTPPCAVCRGVGLITLIDIIISLLVDSRVLCMLQITANNININKEVYYDS